MVAGPPHVPPIICSTGGFWTVELDHALGMIAEAGFDGIELMVTRDPATQSAEIAGRLAEKAGLRIVALHAPMLLLTRRVWGPNFLRIIERSVDVAKELGVGLVVIHPPYVFEVRYQTWLLGQLRRFCAHQEISVAVENMFRLWVRGHPVRGHRWVTPGDLEPFDEITLDTSHCGVDGYDILEALDRCGRQVAHVHLSDSYGDHRDSHALLGQGILPLPRFLDRLPRSGFRGAVSLEFDMRRLALKPELAVEGLIRSREFCEEHLGG